jgi:hypothetical protein
MIKTGIACASLITLIAGAMVGLDSFFARKEVNQAEHLTLKKKTMLVDMRLQQQIYYDRIDREEAILRDYESQYGDDCVNAPSEKRAKCDRAKREIKKAEDAVEKVPEMVEKTY